jgi:hypothetical protein
MLAENIANRLTPPNMPPIHSQIDRLVAAGLHPKAVSIRRDGNKWTCRVALDDWCDTDELGDTLPHHVITLNRASLPPGVEVSDMSRWPDDVIDLPAMSDEQAEALIAGVASYGLAPDWAAFAAPGSRPQHWLTKPLQWLREPPRTALLKKHGHI